MTDHNSGATDPAEEGGAADTRAANVVPFPRAWYGSVEELVPIDLAPPRSAQRSDTVADASAFWGGDTTQASVAQDAIEEDLTSEQSALAEETERRWQEDGVQGSRERYAGSEEASYATGGLPHRVPSGMRTPAAKPTRRLLVALVLAVIGVLLAVISVAALGGGG